MREQENHIEILIAKYLTGETTAEEKKVVSDWINESAENKKYFDDLQFIYSKTPSLKEWEQFDTDSAWKKLKLDFGSGGKIIPINRSAYNWIAVAASLTLIAVLSYILVFNQPVSEPELAWSASTVGQVKQDTLPDGTLAFMNKETELAFTYDKKDNLKKVALEGEAYFDIENNKEERFQIEIDDLIIEDIGTSFNVNAYPKSELITVIVEKGEVALYTKTDPGIRVHPGETGIFNKTTKSFALISEADPNALAYKTRFFSFNNTLLENVIVSLEEVYDVTIAVRNEKLRGCRITVTFRDEEIDTIMDIIGATLELEVYKVNANQFDIDGDGCNN